MEATQVKTQTQQNAPAQFKPPKKKRRWVRRLVAVLVVAAILAVLLLRLMSAGTQAVAGAYLSDTAQVREMTVAVSGTGTIQPNQSYQVTTLISGEVLEAPCEEGQTVNKGDLLFRIDAKDVENNIQQLELNLRSAQLNLDDLLKRQADNREDCAVSAEADGVITKLYVEQGDAVMAGAPIADLLDRERMKLTVPFQSADAAGFYEGQSAVVTVDGTAQTLTGTVDSIAATDEVGPGGALVRQVTLLVQNPGALSDASRGTAAISGAACASGGAFTYAASKQIVAKASGDVDALSIREGDRVTDGQVVAVLSQTDMDTQIESARIQVENARLSLQNARDKLEDYSITSTITGTVIEKNVDAGDNVGGSTAATAGYTYMAVIYDLSELTFDVSVDELDINKIRTGQRVEITADALDGKSFTGVVDKVNINGTTVGGYTTYPVTVKVDGSPAELYPGMNVSAKIVVEQAGQVLCIPVDMVGRGDTVLVAGPGCLDENGSVVDPTAIEERQVTLGRNDEEYIEVLSGLEEGDVVLSENQASNAMAAMMGMGM